METHYTVERNVQIVIGLLKAHGVRRVIASPGTTNITFVESVQHDPWFKVYSSVDERSAAYMACGMAAESGEPVALSCTGATASRNYAPGLTEAFYRQLPVVAVTAMQHPGRIGQYAPQVLDRTVQLRDAFKASVQATTCRSAEDEWSLNVRVNEALLELAHGGGGPVHINLETEYTPDFSCTALPVERVIRRYLPFDEFPPLPSGRIGVFVGAHAPFGGRLSAAVDAFCRARDAVVLCDQTSNYRGEFRALFPLVLTQDHWKPDFATFRLVIHIGTVSGAYADPNAGEVWRVAEDGRVRDTFRKLTGVFEMPEAEFFERYAEGGDAAPESSLAPLWRSAYERLSSEVPELPFSNLWMAQRMAPRLPDGSRLHLGILNSLRSWNMFETPDTVSVSCNTGGFGIDGVASALLGASLVRPDAPFIGVLGDLAFFYDMNCLGNRHVGRNLRILLVNNGEGIEFKNYSHMGHMFGADADPYVAAAGHFGRKSPDLVRHYAEDLGFEYLPAHDKGEFLEALPRLVDPEVGERPLLVEAFTSEADESGALEAVRGIEVDSSEAAKMAIKGVIGDGGVKMIKRILGR